MYNITITADEARKNKQGRVDKEQLHRNKEYQLFIEDIMKEIEALITRSSHNMMDGVVYICDDKAKSTYRMIMDEVKTTFELKGFSVYNGLSPYSIQINW